MQNILKSEIKSLDDEMEQLEGKAAGVRRFFRKCCVTLHTDSAPLGCDENEGDRSAGFRVQFLVAALYFALVKCCFALTMRILSTAFPPETPTACSPSR